MKSRFLPLIIVLILIPISRSQSQVLPWDIASFESSISVQVDGEVLIEETIEADFPSARHGIYRDLPYRYRNGLNFAYTDVEVIAVTRNGVEEPFSTSSNYANLQIKIGDADEWVEGKQVYKITYQVDGVLRSVENNIDELYWNVTGDGWDALISTASVRLDLPVKVLQSNCYRGVKGSTDLCKTLNKTDQSIIFTDQELLPGEEMTVAVGWQSGQVPINKPIDSDFWILIAGTLMSLGWLGYVWTRLHKDWRLYGRDPEVGETTVVQYQPPKNSVMENMFLIKNSINPRDMAGGIIELAQLGYLTIEISEQKLLGLVSQNDYNLTFTDKDKSKLTPSQLELFNSLFYFTTTNLDGPRSVKLSELKNKFYTRIKSIQKATKSEVKNLNFYDRMELGSSVNRPIIISVAVVFISVLVIMMGAFYSFAINILLVPMIVVGVLIMMLAGIYSWLSPKRSQLGTETVEHLLGYRDFIKTAEKHRVKFYEDQNIIFEMMPYAIAFGLVDKLAKVVEELGLENNAPSWYMGASALNFSDFSNNLESFATELETTIQSSPSGSGSGSGGGGSSGGGFGGGGGGSW